MIMYIWDVSGTGFILCWDRFEIDKQWHFENLAKPHPALFRTLLPIPQNNRHTNYHQKISRELQYMYCRIVVIH
jgi:hypothetical protein